MTTKNSPDVELKESPLKVAYINGEAFPILEGETILSFLRRHSGNQDVVPTLCDAPNLKPFGSCRVCSVDVALQEGGHAKTVASCHTPIAENWHILPDSDRVRKLRKNILELVLTDHPLDCLTCEVNNNCELQTVAARVGIRDVRYPAGKNHLDRKKDTTHPYMRSDLSKCINCYRCVRVCDEVQGEFVLSMHGRGFENRIIKGADVSFDESPCVSCGACSQTCPTAAISDIYQSKAVNGDRKVRTVCTYCGVGCNLEVKVAGHEITSIQAPYDAETNQGHTCLKGRFAFRFYNHSDRLKTPLIKRNGSFVEATWDEAYDFIAEKLNSIKQKHGADSIAGISSARCTNEENYLMQKFIRSVIGTNNIDCCARVCHSPTALGMQRSFGTGAATNSIEDIQHTSCILVIGANPTDAHPVTGAKIRQFALKSKPLIVIDPRETTLARLATWHLQLRPGTNVALLNMMLYTIVNEDLVDHDFIESRCEGYDDFCKSILDLDMNELEKITGVDQELVREAARAYATASEAMSFHGLGVTEHTQGTFTVMLIADLAMLTGNIGRRGVGVNPLRGQNNVQGAADMGCQPHQGAGYLDVTAADLHQKYEAFYGRKLSNQIGLKIPEMFDAAREKKLKALWIMGEDVVQTDPNTLAVIESMKSLDLLVVQELFMTETAKYADVVLPGASFLEKSGTFTNGERRVQAVHAVVDPLPGTRTDGQIIVDIMNKMGYNQPDYEPATMLEEISKIVPFFKGIRWHELGKNGKQWPVAEDGQDTAIMHTESFKRGKGYIHFQPWQESKEIVNHGGEYPFILTTGRELEHYNCGTMTRRTPNNDILLEDVLSIHPKDARKKKINDGDKIKLKSARGEVQMKAFITRQVKPGILYTTFHFPEVMLNIVTGNEHDSEALCPEYKVVAVDVEKI